MSSTSQTSRPFCKLRRSLRPFPGTLTTPPLQLPRKVVSTISQTITRRPIKFGRRATTSRNTRVTSCSNLEKQRPESKMTPRRLTSSAALHPLSNQHLIRKPSSSIFSNRTKENPQETTAEKKMGEWITVFKVLGLENRNTPALTIILFRTRVIFSNQIQVTSASANPSCRHERSLEKRLTTIKSTVLTQVLTQRGPKK